MVTLTLSHGVIQVFNLPTATGCHCGNPRTDHQALPLMTPLMLDERVGRHQKPVPVHTRDMHMFDRALRALHATTPLRGSDHRAVGTTHELSVLSDSIRGVVNVFITKRCRNVHGHIIPFHGAQAFACELMNDKVSGQTSTCRSASQRPAKPVLTGQEPGGRMADTVTTKSPPQ